jgi:3-hydroxyisobutyrate dehydrogenase-like beta-hydroxyacid dehydrogenase
MADLKNITVIGLGSMGSALATLLLKNNYQVTVWNRTLSKAQSLSKLGARQATTVVSAIEASEVIIVCVANYQSSHEILRNRDVEQALQNKLLIQLSTGTPKDASDEADWASIKGIHLLDGAIMVTPSQMGTADAMILVSGKQTVFSASEAILKTLAVNTIYSGEKASTASALDLALLSYFFSAVIGFAHAARICEAEGLDIKALGAMVQGWSPAMGSIIKECSERIACNQYGNTESTLQTCFYSMELISRQAQEAGISTLFPAFATAIFKKGIDQNLALEDGAAVFKVLA